MKKIAFAALLTFAIPVNADNLSEGFWRSDKTGVVASFSYPDFLLFSPDSDGPINCRIVDWPISSPIAEGRCEDGSVHAIEIREGSVLLDGWPLVQSFEAPD